MPARRSLGETVDLVGLSFSAGAPLQHEATGEVGNCSTLLARAESLAPRVRSCFAMGFLGLGSAYSWEDSVEEAIEYVRKHGIEQFLVMWEKVKDLKCPDLFWGDELEYGILRHDDVAGTVVCSLRGAEIMEVLKKREDAKETKVGEEASARCSWVPEYGSWMLEGTPAEPYSGFASDLVLVEKNMRSRRARLLGALQHDEICPTVPCFPLLGAPGTTFTDPPLAPGGPVAESLFVSDGMINPHPRFAALAANIRKRRGSKVDIRMPRFVDTHTPTPTQPAGGPPPADLAAALGMEEVQMDAMAFGMGCCCLQVTFQAQNVDESRHLYDQLAVLTPLMLALTAATPAARGVLLDTDSRWDIISQSVDDRTPAERMPTRPPTRDASKRGSPADADGSAPASASEPPPPVSSKMAGGGVTPHHKSRYASISTYICTKLAKKGAIASGKCSKYLNDVSAPYDEADLQKLVDRGIDPILARHIAHLFSRDPLVVFRGRVSEIPDDSTEHFENIQSTNWQTVRWKPPPELLIIITELLIIITELLIIIRCGGSRRRPPPSRSAAPPTSAGASSSARWRCSSPTSRMRPSPSSPCSPRASCSSSTSTSTSHSRKSTRTCAARRSATP